MPGLAKGQWTSFLGICVVAAMGCGTKQTLTEPIKVAFEDPLHLIVLEVRIADQGPFRFFLDSGATSTIIDTELAKRLGLPTGPSSTGRGTAAGSQVTTAQVTGGVDFEIAPNFQVHVDQVTTAPFAKVAQPMIGDHYDGILGSAIFQQFVIEVDYVGKSVVFHDPETFRFEGKGTVLELDFPRQLPKLPFIKATLTNGDHRLANFPVLVDSGGQTMGMISVALRREWDGLIAPNNRIVDKMGATGLSNDPEGTMHEAYSTQMERLDIGPFQFGKPQVSYSAGGPGLSVMGASLLHRFTVVFDYSRKQLILTPNTHFQNPLRTDQSGVTFIQSPDRTFEVMFVSTGTPAHEAGLVRGDRILSVNEVPVSQLGLNKVRIMFCRSSTFRLELGREGETIGTVMKTRSLYDD